MKITVKKLSDLHKPARNIRRHSDKQITEYVRSIEMFGQIKPLVVDENGERLLKRAFDKMGLTARAAARILKVARTIADLAGEENILPVHLAEAIQYRNTERKYI